MNRVNGLVRSGPAQSGSACLVVSSCMCVRMCVCVCVCESKQAMLAWIEYTHWFRLVIICLWVCLKAKRHSQFHGALSQKERANKNTDFLSVNDMHIVYQLFYRLKPNQLLIIHKYNCSFRMMSSTYRPCFYTTLLHLFSLQRTLTANNQYSSFARMHEMQKLNKCNTSWRRVKHWQQQSKPKCWPWEKVLQLNTSLNAT